MAKQTLTVQLMHANARIAELEAELALRPRTPAPRAVYTPTPRVLPAHMVAARELAMRTGCVVKVQA